MARNTWIDTQLDGVAATIEAHASRLQSAGVAIQQSDDGLGNIPTQSATLIAAVQAQGTTEQKARLAKYTVDYQALKTVSAAASGAAVVQALRDLEV